jgi:hypothetical protein
MLRSCGHASLSVQRRDGHSMKPINIRIEHHNPAPHEMNAV